LIEGRLTKNVLKSTTGKLVGSDWRSIMRDTQASPHRLFGMGRGFAVAAGLLLPGCIYLLPTAIREEPPLKPPTATHRDRQTDDTGQQQASFQLTDQGRGHLDTGQWDEALSVLQKAISLDPSNPYAYYYLAKARYFRNEYSQTLSLLGKADLYLQDDPAWLSWVYALRGKTYEGLSRWTEAREQYRQALSNNPRNPEARDGISRLDQRSDIDSR
jgi:tetratricopeptide (TPR) repeat protein